MRFWASGLACCIPIILGCLQYGCVHVNDCTCCYYDFRRRFKSFKLDQAMIAQTTWSRGLTQAAYAEARDSLDQ